MGTKVKKATKKNMKRVSSNKRSEGAGFSVIKNQNTTQKNHLLRLELEQSIRELEQSIRKLELLNSMLEEWVERAG
ncbi:hypothetical protein LR48_Vigan11g158200 [Vigna angularis]|uniref:Uncharacterized protein n=1 Tax=Phaseolus angularis TaxID=3914 RepID=A0A0L9VUE8_PHAAN|nr:uncharacterized protein HKW66_Vig0204560 [Vigna angularis]KOM58548.1 hypothetical protein LR48_Vigan11g158200 [Vigna angularis]